MRGALLAWAFLLLCFSLLGYSVLVDAAQRVLWPRSHRRHRRRSRPLHRRKEGRRWTP